MDKKMLLVVVFSMFILMMCGCSILDFSESQLESIGIPNVLEESEKPDFKEINVVVDDVYFYYKQLSSEEQLTYRRLFEGILNGDERILLEERNGDVVDRVMQAMLYDHPEIFWCEGAYEYITYITHIELLPVYTYTGDELTAKKSEIESIARDFLNTVDINASDYDKIKSVYEYVINSVDYEEGVPDNQNIYSSIVNKKSVCAGYARAVQYLLQQMDIECIYTIGTVIGSDDHGWNIVKCNDQYYQLDATYGDRDFTEEVLGTEENDIGEVDTPEELQIDYSYLCCTDAQIYADRNLEDLFEVPECINDDMNYYKQIGRYFEDYTEEVLDDLHTSVFQGDKVWECQFAYQEDYQEMLYEVENGVHGDIVGEYLEQNSFVGEYFTWYVYDDEMYTIACWY